MTKIIDTPWIKKMKAEAKAEEKRWEAEAASRRSAELTRLNAILLPILERTAPEGVVLVGEPSGESDLRWRATIDFGNGVQGEIHPWDDENFLYYDSPRDRGVAHILDNEGKWFEFYEEMLEAPSDPEA